MRIIFLTIFSFSSARLSSEESIALLASEFPMGVPKLCIASHAAIGLRDIRLS